MSWSLEFEFRGKVFNETGHALNMLKEIHAWKINLVNERMNIYFTEFHTFVHNQYIIISTGIHTLSFHTLYIHVCIACSLLILADESSFSLHSAAYYYCQLDGIMRGRHASSADALVPCISCIGMRHAFSSFRRLDIVMQGRHASSADTPAPCISCMHLL